MERTEKKEKLEKWGWEAAVLAVVLAVLCCFAAQKEGYHMDELLSFELSNAEFNPWIVPTQPVGRLAKFVKEEIRGTSFWDTCSRLADTVRDVAVNRGGSRLLQYKADVYEEPVWIGAEQFRGYLTVGREDAFDYLSVYFNVKDDNHPPLHFMLLHTVSSLFRGVIFPFLGCAINILAVLGCCGCLFRTGRLLERHGVLPRGCGRLGGICAGLLYGLSAGAIATVLLIRMYGLLTFFCVASFYIHLKKWLEKGFGRRDRGLAAVTLCGFWTQYFFLFYCLALSAVAAGLLAAGKRYGELKGYLRTMLLSAAVGVAVFPFSVQDVFASGRGVEALQNLGQGFSGYWIRLKAFGALLAEGSFGCLPFWAAALLVLCLALAGGGKGWAGTRRPEENGMPEEAGLPGDGRAFLLFLLVPCACYFFLAARMSPYLVDRYIMPLFPFMAIFLSLLWGRLFWRRSRRLLLLPAVILGIANVALYDGTYLYKGYGKQLEAAERYRELPCICLYDGVGYYENLAEFTWYDRTLLLKLPELEGRKDVSALTSLSRLVVLKKDGVEEEAALEILGAYGFRVEEELISEEESVHGDTVYLCVRAE